MPWLLIRLFIFLFPFVRPMAQEFLSALYQRRTRMDAEGSTMTQDGPRGRVRSFSYSRGPGGTTIVNQGEFSLSIKATSALCLIAIWATMIPAIVAEPGGWPALVFAFMATIAVGLSAWRRLGLSRVIAISAIWGGTALAVAGSSDNWWMGFFAFSATGATVYSFMKGHDLLAGLGVAVAWLVAGYIGFDESGGTQWMAIPAFLTTLAVANSLGRSNRAVIAAVAWAVAGVIMIAAGGYYWLSFIAALAALTTFGLGGFTMPRKFEWDLFDRGQGGRPNSTR